ncbi:MAG: hypothetical protein M3M85_01015 [bacterium]|nr:hypothetical protein [bacterium]
MNRQLSWKGSKRPDGLITGLLYLTLFTRNATPVRDFRFHLDVLGRNLVLLDDVKKKQVVEVNDREPLPTDVPRLMTWAHEVLIKLLDYYRPVYVNLPVRQSFGDCENAPLIVSVDQQFHWELVAGPSRLSANVDLSAMM